MEVLYHIRPYFVVIFPYIGLIYGRYLQSRILKWPLIKWGDPSSSYVSFLSSRCSIPPPFGPPSNVQPSLAWRDWLVDASIVTFGHITTIPW